MNKTMALRPKRIICFLLTFFFWSCFADVKLFAQEGAKTEKTEREMEKERLLRERVEKKKEEPKIEEVPVEEAAPQAAEEKILVKKIIITGATLVSQKEINDIILPYQEKELSLREMQKITDLITDLYRQKGYVTSRAYLPPQKIENGNLQIRVIEGATGDIQVKGNRYFRTELIRNKIVLRRNEPFNYNTLRRGLTKINEHPDRQAKAVLTPGKEPATTDVILDVNDRLPIHIGLDYDNFGSRFIGRSRYRTTLSHNNLLGLDDILTLQYQITDGENFRLLNLRYLFPVKEDLKLGLMASDSRLKLGKEFEDLNARAKSRLYGAYASQTLIDKENLALNLNAGFDYKDIFNFQAGSETSRDRLRIAKAGWDLDVSDNYGRTIFTNELDFGIPNIFAGLSEDDPRASRAGSGGKFFKDELNLLRLQRLPFSSTLLWKNQLQFSPDILPAAEQFQIGGIANVRGYPPAEQVGDRGYAMTWELSIPPYLLPKDIKVPYSKARFYDAIRIVTFYDWANARLKRPQAGEEKSKTLRGAGAGLRFNLPEDFSARVEFAWPLDNKPSDGSHKHTWIEISKRF